MLSRPWRIYAKAVFIQCEMSSQITDEGFHDWNKKNLTTLVIMLNINALEQVINPI